MNYEILKFLESRGLNAFYCGVSDKWYTTKIRR